MNKPIALLAAPRVFANAGPVPPAHVETLVGVAGRAPSVHNTQPWRFVYTADGTLELRMDPERGLAIADPESREAVISCGAALLNVRLGIRRLGLVPTLLTTPSLDDPLLLASVRTRPAGGATYDEGLLIDAVTRRHTHRGGFDAVPVTVEERELIRDSAQTEGAALHFVEPGQFAGGLTALATFADDALRADPEARAELAGWTPGPGSARPDGVPTTAYIRADRSPAGTSALPPRDFGLGRGWGRPEEASPIRGALAVLTTDGDTIADWLRAGQALQRALLTATTLWVFARFATQPIELPHTREALRALLGSVGGHGFPQMLIEFGHASSLQLTPRRRIDDVLHRD